MINVVTYEQRVAQMKKPGDEDDQLRKAKAYAKRLRTAAKSKPSLEEKLAYQDAARQADAVVRKLRVNIFELQDRLEQSA